MACCASQNAQISVIRDFQHVFRVIGSSGRSLGSGVVAPRRQKARAVRSPCFRESRRVADHRGQDIVLKFGCRLARPAGTTNQVKEQWALFRRWTRPMKLAIFVHGFAGITWGVGPPDCLANSADSAPFDEWDYAFVSYDWEKSRAISTSPR
jgi:hypothetical protein